MAALPVVSIKKQCGYRNHGAILIHRIPLPQSAAVAGKAWGIFLAAVFRTVTATSLISSIPSSPSVCLLQLFPVTVRRVCYIWPGKSAAATVFLSCVVLPSAQLCDADKQFLMRNPGFSWSKRRWVVDTLPFGWTSRTFYLSTVCYSNMEKLWFIVVRM